MVYLSVFFIPGIRDKYHFGTKDWEETKINCPSHTFYSAIINNYSLINENIENIKENIIVSDLFPVIFNKENEPIIKFIPKPICKFRKLDSLINEKPKLWKKISFVSEGFYKNILNYENMNEITENDFTILGGKFAITNKEFETIRNYILNNERRDLNKRKEELKKISLFRMNREVKTSVDRLTGTSLEGKLFGSKFVKPNFYLDDKNKEISLKVGYWAIVNIKENNFQENVKKAVELIKYNGIGGERSVGAGFFDKIIIKEDNYQISDSKYYIILSSYIPTLEEWKNKKDWDYLLDDYFGWCFSYVSPSINNTPKKTTKYIVPGSVVSERIEGSIVNLSLNKNFDIWFNGKPILLPLNKK